MAASITETGAEMDIEISGEDAAVSPIEMNISNTNSSSMIVLNDLCLLELICKYPFLYSKEEQDSDYNEWAWKQITMEFNASYESLPLSVPFSTEELQWRWNILLPLIGTLSKAEGEIPLELFTIVTEIERSQNAENVEPPMDVTMAQDFLLSQLPMVESMTLMERRRLEADFLDIILQHELETHGSVPLGPDEEATVKTEYDEFLRTIRVKELPLSALAGLSLDVKSAEANEAPAGSTQKSNMVISNVFSVKDVIDNPPTSIDPAPAPTVSPPIAAQPEAVDRAASVSPPLDIKTEVEVALAAIELAIEMENIRENNPTQGNQKSPEKHVTSADKPQADDGHPPIENLRYVPLKSAKYYTKKVRVRVKRVDLEDFVPLSNLSRRSARLKPTNVKCT